MSPSTDDICEQTRGFLGPQDAIINVMRAAIDE